MTEVQRNTTPWRRDPAAIEHAFHRWARSIRGDRAVVSEFRMPESGMANDTVLFSVDGEPLAARLAPAPGSPYATFPTFDLELQRKVIDLVRERTDVPAPEVVHLERSEAWVGVRFLVVRAIEGHVPSDSPPYLLDPGGWFLQGGAGERERFERSTIDVLTRVHRIADDGEATAFLHLDAPGATALARQLAHQRRYYDWARDGRRVPVLEQALDVLERTLPANDRAVLNWGDSRPGNIIYRDFEPVGVLDWEMASVGPPEVDLAWMTFFQKFFAGMAEQYGLPPVPAMFRTEDAVATYEGLSGDELDRLAWYEAFAGLRFGIILARMRQRSIAFGVQQEPDDPNDLMMFPALLERLLEAI
ncbi:MAG TPA: phosphotransferase family protein [Acidimicrobiales bacterium]|nr:phosphotransferase family protein [Acidimicrobiales bacterium]